MYDYTVALATRLKRKVFAAGAIAETFEKILTVKISAEGMSLISLKTLEYGAVIELSSPFPVQESSISRLIRISTSAPLRYEFPDLWSLPSLWTKRIYFASGFLNEEKKQEIDAFFDSIKTR